MQHFLKKYGVFLIMLVLTWKSFENYKHIGPENQVLRADGKGYYAYLPAVFIYHDNQTRFIDYYEHKYNNPDSYADFRNKEDGVYVNKYYAGVAILQLPFFLMAHVTSAIMHKPTDGYAPLYQQFFVIGGLFYLFIGMQAFLLYLLAFKVPAWQGLVVIACMLLGTNCYHYAVYEQCMSHLYSLSLISIFIYGTYRVIHTQSKKWIVISLFILGMIVILRPVNLIIVAFIPFIAGSWRNLKNGLRFVFGNYLQFVVGIFVALVPFIVQSLLWHWQTGKFFVYSYGNEAMEWGNPKMWHILFSYRKGWFVWTPLAFIGICGLLFIVKDTFRFLSISLFMLLVIYVLSCWWTPDYGMGFGAREFIEFLFVPAIGLAMLLKRARNGLIMLLLVLVFSFGIYVNQVQAEQYRHHIILWDGMNKDDYWRVFLQRGAGYYYWLDERDGFKHPDFINTKIDKSYTNSFEQPAGWDNDSRVSDKTVHTGKAANYIDNAHRVSAIWSHLLDENELRLDSLIQASVWFNGPQPDFTALVISFENKGRIISKNDVRIRKFADHNFSWNRAMLQQIIPAGLPEGTLVKAYVDDTYNEEKFFLDDFRVDLVKK
jgi:hypothetical protein